MTSRWVYQIWQSIGIFLLFNVVLTAALPVYQQNQLSTDSKDDSRTSDLIDSLRLQLINELEARLVARLRARATSAGGMEAESEGTDNQSTLNDSDKETTIRKRLFCSVHGCSPIGKRLDTSASGRIYPPQSRGSNDVLKRLVWKALHDDNFK